MEQTPTKALERYESWFGIGSRERHEAVSRTKAFMVCAVPCQRLIQRPPPGSADGRFDDASSMRRCGLAPVGTRPRGAF